jgi:hypothetical protein
MRNEATDTTDFEVKNMPWMMPLPDLDIIELDSGRNQRKQ